MDGKQKKCVKVLITLTQKCNKQYQITVKKKAIKIKTTGLIRYEEYEKSKTVMWLYVPKVCGAA